MKFKKLLSFIVLTSILLSLAVTSVYGESISEEKRQLMIAAGEIPPDNGLSEENVKIKRDEAIELAKKMLKDPDLAVDSSLYEVSNANLFPKWNSKGGIWNIDLYNKQSQGGNINAGVDAETGEIISFNKWEHYDGHNNFVATFTKDEARKNAEKFLKKKLGDEFSTFEPQKEYPYNYNYNGIKGPVTYNFSYIKKMNGIECQEYMLNIGIDGTNGNIQSYNINRFNVDPSVLPSEKDAITAKEALKKYIDSTVVGLQYFSVFEDLPFSRSQQKIKLAYTTFSPVHIMDAKTGEFIEFDGKPIKKIDDTYKRMSQKPLQMNSDAKLASRSLSEKETEKMAQKIKSTAEEILKIKFQDGGMSYSKPFYIDYRIHGNNGQDQIFSYDWFVNTDKINCNMNMSINARTGNVNNLSINKHSFEEMGMMNGKEKAKEVKEKYSWDQCKEKAIELVKKIVPDQYGFYEDQNVSQPEFDENSKKYMREYNYNFTRVINGVRFRENSINISIDRETGELLNFYFNWSDVNFPETNSIIEIEKASALFFESVEPVLSYRYFSTYDTKTGTQKFSEKPSMIYMFSNKYNNYYGCYMDAESGKLMDWSGRELQKENDGADPKLPEHWAKRSTELLIAQGILQKHDIKYEDEVTRFEAVKMMSLAKGMSYYDYVAGMKPSFEDVLPDSEYYHFVENVVKQKILTKAVNRLNGGESITREEFAQLLVNLIGYGDIAKHSAIYKLPEGITCSSPELMGSVAICHALGVLPVKDGEKFEGSAKVTYAEAAVALYKALSHIK